MVYFMGQDIALFITTEGTNTTVYGLCSDAGVVSWSATTGSNHIFAGPAQGSLDYRDAGTKGVPQLTNVIGLDVSIGTMDEDITYFGLRQTTKAEIKKETTISITRKKESLVWDSVFNNEATDVYGRWGVSGTTGLSGLSEPTVNLGYRVHVMLQNGTEVMSIPGCVLAAHTVTTNVDGSADETLEFTTPLTPSYGQEADQAVLTTADL